jgi:hypothetical protein
MAKYIVSRTVRVRKSNQIKPNQTKSNQIKPKLVHPALPDGQKETVANQKSQIKNQKFPTAGKIVADSCCHPAGRGYVSSVR